MRTLVATLVQAGLTYATAQALAGAPFSVRGGLRIGLRRFFPYVGASILYILAISLGMLLLVVPGIIAFAMLAVAPALAVIERTGPIESQSRSRALTRGNRWRILAVVVPVYFVPGAILAAVGFSMARAGHAVGNALLAQQLVILIVNIVLTPIYFALPAVLYHHLLRARGNIAAVGIADVFA